MRSKNHHYQMVAARLCFSFVVVSLFTLPAAFSKSAQVKPTQSKQSGGKKDSEAAKEERAIALVWARPEVKSWLKNFRGAKGESKLGGHASADAEPDAAAAGNDLYTVHVYEDMPDHAATFGYYQVNLRTSKVNLQNQ